MYNISISKIGFFNYANNIKIIIKKISAFAVRYTYEFIIDGKKIYNFVRFLKNTKMLFESTYL